MLCGYLSVHLSGKEIQKRRDMCIRRADSFCCRVETNMTFKATICCLVTQSCPTLSDPMNHSMPGFFVLHHLPEFAETHVHWVHDAVQPSHPLLSPLLLPSIFPSIRVFSNESVLCIRWPKYWSFGISPSNEYSELISFRIYWFDLLAVQGILNTPIQINVNK